MSERAWIAEIPDSGDYGTGLYPAVIVKDHGPAFGPAHFFGMFRCRLYGLLHGYGWLEVNK